MKFSFLGILLCWCGSVLAATCPPTPTFHFYPTQKGMGFYAANHEGYAWVTDKPYPEGWIVRLNFVEAQRYPVLSTRAELCVYELMFKDKVGGMMLLLSVPHNNKIRLGKDSAWVVMGDQYSCNLAYGHCEFDFLP